MGKESVFDKFLKWLSEPSTITALTTFAGIFGYANTETASFGEWVSITTVFVTQIFNLVRRER
jgi:hypothetical protein